MVGTFGDDDSAATRPRSERRFRSDARGLGPAPPSPRRRGRRIWAGAWTMTLKRAGIMSSCPDASSPILIRAAPRSSCRRGFDDHVLARQVLGQRAAIDPSLAGSGRLCPASCDSWVTSPRRRQSIVRRPPASGPVGPDRFSPNAGRNDGYRSSLMMAIRRSFSTPAAMTSA